MVTDVKRYIKLFSKKNVCFYLIFSKVVAPVYRVCMFVFRSFLFLLNSLSFYGFVRVLRIYFRYIWLKITKSYLNIRLERSVSRLANADTQVAGSAVYKGFLYHDIPFPDQMKFYSHRNNSIERLRKINKYVPFKGRRVLDIGCSNGSISLAAGMKGAISVIGLDYDKQAIRVAETLRDKYCLNNVKFINQKLEPQRLDLPEVDLLIWLSNWMWLVKAYGLEKGLDLLYDIPYVCRAEEMVFESAADDGKAAINGTTQKDIESFLKRNTPYANIRSVGPFKDKWRERGKERIVFICTERRQYYKGKQSIIERIQRNIIRKSFESSKLWAMDLEIKCLKRLETCPYFPTILNIGQNWYEMEYCGEPVENVTQLSDLFKIVRILKENDIIHRDINPNNLLFQNGKLQLVDFGWAVVDEKEPTQKVPEGLGRGFYDRNNFDDSVACERIKQFFQEKS